jgi:N-acetylmuramoyl-L-alanine amidase
MKRTIIFVRAAALGAALFIFAADTNFPIYFPNSKLIVKAEVRDRTVYLPIKDIIEHMNVPYTDAIALETLTIRSGSNRLVVTKNSGLISYNDHIILLPSWILRENNRWLAPVEFLTMGLGQLTGTDFRYRPGTSRVFVGNVEAPELEMNAQTLGPITRVTIRCAAPIKIDVKREDPTKAILAIDRAPLDPTRERFDHRDRLLHSVAFDDSDGASKIVLDMTREVSDLRVTSADNNRIFFVDLLKTGESVSAAPPPAPEAAPAPKPDVVAGERKVRVVVIDPGHGGMDPGAKAMTVAEKDLTLILARKLKSGLQARLGATVLLTRDSDASMDNEARSAVANNNQANLLVSLHAGYSLNKGDSGSSIFIMKEDFGTASATDVARDQLFLPWYLGYRAHHQASAAAAAMLEEELSKAIPAWKFPVRTAPLAVLSSATMPSMLLEIGNLNNPNNAQTLMEPTFQNRIIDSIVEAVRRFSESPQAAN